jgi:hypothetical protein
VHSLAASRFTDHQTHTSGRPPIIFRDIDTDASLHNNKDNTQSHLAENRYA